MLKKTAFLLVLIYSGPFQVPGQQVDSTQAHPLKTDTARKEQIVEMEPVTIHSYRSPITQHIDGITFNVNQRAFIAASDASDVLRKVPMLSIDASGGLWVRGNSNVKLLIDNLPAEMYASSVADALKAIRAENIERVEVTTNPSSRYDAEGATAVVNIITKKPPQNTTTGSINGLIGNRSGNIGGDVYHRSGAFLLHADALYQKYRNRNGSILQRNTNNIALLQQNETWQTGGYFFGGISLFYNPDSLNTFSLSYRARRFPNETNSLSYNYALHNQVPELLFQREMETNNQSNGNTFTGSFTGQSKKKKLKYTILGMYLQGRQANNYELNQSEPGYRNTYHERFAGASGNNDMIIQGDYTQSLTNHWKWEAGSKITVKKTDNNNLYETRDPITGIYNSDSSRSADFSYKYKIYAGYINTNIEWKKWGFSAGLRYEQTRIKALFKTQSISIPSFSNLVPQLLLSRTFNNKKVLKLSYTVKLVRPQIAYLDPTLKTSDSLTLQYGNPYLEPELTKRYELSYSINDPRLFRDFVLFFNNNRNTIENINIPGTNGIWESTWMNLGKNQRVGGSATLNWKPVPELSIGSTLTAQYVWLYSGASGMGNDALMWRLTLNGSYQLSRGYSLDVYGFFDSDNLRLQGYRSGWKFYNMTFNKKFKNERLNIGLRVETFLTRYTYIHDVIHTQEMKQRQSYRYQNQNIRLTFSYKIGKQDIRSPVIGITE